MRVKVRGWITPEGYVGCALPDDIPSRALKIELDLEFNPEELGAGEVDRMEQALRVLEAINPGGSNYEARHRAAKILRGEGT